MFHARAISTDIDVGELREAMIGQPIIAPLRSISDDTRPVVNNVRPRVSIPCERQYPSSLSIVL